MGDQAAGRRHLIGGFVQILAQKHTRYPIFW